MVGAGSVTEGWVPLGSVAWGREEVPPGRIRSGFVSPSGAITLFSSSTREMVSSEKKAVASQGLEV